MKVLTVSHLFEVELKVIHKEQQTIFIGFTV